jgi:hypothetical protein
LKTIIGIILIVLLLIAAFCLFLTWWYWHPLWAELKERERHLDNAENQKSDSKNVQALCEFNESVSLLDQPIRLLFHPFRCVSLIFGKQGKKLCHVSELDTHGIGMASRFHSGNDVTNNYIH